MKPRYANHYNAKTLKGMISNDVLFPEAGIAGVTAENTSRQSPAFRFPLPISSILLHIRKAHISEISLDIQEGDFKILASENKSVSMHSQGNTDHLSMYVSFHLADISVNTLLPTGEFLQKQMPMTLICLSSIMCDK